MLQSQHPRFSRMASNVALLCSTLVWSSRSMEYLHIDPIYATDWSDPSLFCLGTGTAPPFSGWENPWWNKQWMNGMPQADGKTALGILWPQNACSIETNENYLSKVRHSKILTPAWTTWKSDQNVAYSRRDRLQTFCPTELFGHLGWRRTDPEFLLRRRASQVLRSAQMTSKFGMESGWVEHKISKTIKNHRKIAGRHLVGLAKKTAWTIQGTCRKPIQVLYPHVIFITPNRPNSF